MDYRSLGMYKDSVRRGGKGRRSRRKRTMGWKKTK